MDRLYKTIFKGFPELDLTAYPETILSTKSSETDLRETDLRETPTIAKSASDDHESKTTAKKRTKQADSKPIGGVHRPPAKRRKR